MSLLIIIHYNNLWWQWSRCFPLWTRVPGLYRCYLRFTV